MPDYGHDLTFGTFITPQAQRPQDAVALAQLTERAGLELATFQDHPYQPAFLDTWTLLSWVAAQTETLRVAPNVLNLPLRQPAVMARAAASLDLLSGGRVELGLGAGAFWDGIEAMGGERLTPGQSVDALSEAIDVIRGIWDVSTRRGVRVDGEHHRVTGAKRGPEPAHDIGLWLGAYKPRMLRLTGRKADGWLPSLAYMAPDGVRRRQRARSTRRPRRPAATRARSGGCSTCRARSARERVPGGPARAVGRGAAAARARARLQHVHRRWATTRPRSSVFGGEVAPALREAVARERASAGTPTGPRPRPAGAGGAPRRASTTTRCPRRWPPRRSSPATATTARSAPPTSAPARRGSCCAPATPRRSARRSPSRASRTSRSRCAAAATASAGARPTTAGSSSTSARWTRSRCSTARAAACGSAPAPAGATSPASWPRTAWR